MSKRLRSVGIILLLGGILGLGIPAFVDQPPDIRSLQPMRLELSKTPFVRQARKAGTLGLLCFTDRTLRLPSICRFWSCELPETLRTLDPGSGLVVWQHEITIWQIAHDGEIIYSYAQALQADHDERLRMYTVFTALAVAGLLLLFFNRAKTAPLPLNRTSSHG
jgi:hypothetical protein